jgi:TRAP-type mannitol/chloroaromatic compound transport system permease small subunit
MPSQTASQDGIYSEIIHRIDAFTDRFGRALAWLCLPLTLGLTWEVIARYGLNSPTSWAFDLTFMLYGTIFMLGCPYALLKGGHIRTDMLYEKWTMRGKANVDLTAYLLFFFPTILMLLITTTDDAWYSFTISERSEQTALRPPLWPFKAIVPLTMLLLLVQGVSEFLKSLHAWRTGQLFEKKEGFEV